MKVFEAFEAINQLKIAHPGAILNEINFRNEMTLEINPLHLIAVLSFMKQSPVAGFEVLIDLTAVDYFEPTQETKVVYFLLHPSSYQRIRITVLVKREEKLPSVVFLWDGADWYERELYDLFGVYFEGHPDLKRILMPDDWKGHPLRKEYPLTEEPVAFKHGVKPKVPSEIIRVCSNQLNIHE